MSQHYEDQPENFESVPVSSRRSDEEVSLLEYLRLREEIEEAYKKIRTNKRRIEELVASSASLQEVDTRLRKIPRKAEESREEKKQKRKAVDLGEAAEEASRKKKKNAIKKKKQEHRKNLKEGYTMSEKEIRSEGGEVEKQFIYFKDLGEGKSSTRIVKGIEGLKLSSQVGEEEEEEMEM